MNNFQVGEVYIHISSRKLVRITYIIGGMIFYKYLDFEVAWQRDIENFKKCFEQNFTTAMLEVTSNGA